MKKELTPREYEVYRQVARMDYGYTVQDLATLLCVSKQKTSWYLKKLHAKGWIDYRPRIEVRLL